MKFRSVIKLAVAGAIVGGLAIGSVTPAYAISRPLGVSGYAIGGQAVAIANTGTISDPAISSEVVLANADSLRSEDASLDEAKAATGGSGSGPKSLGALLALVGSLLVGSMETTMN